MNKMKQTNHHHQANHFRYEVIMKTYIKLADIHVCNATGIPYTIVREATTIKRKQTALKTLFEFTEHCQKKW
jgi:hypothetical protein